ncbi:MAG: hypothetical protein ACK4PR_02580 [Gammaproteobacteria bacterium]
MSDYRVSKVAVAQHKTVEERKFDSKEDAEHYAKNQSVTDTAHSYEIQRNHSGEFKTIKAYQAGQVVGE